MYSPDGPHQADVDVLRVVVTSAQVPLAGHVLPVVHRAVHAAHNGRRVCTRERRSGVMNVVNVVLFEDKAVCVVLGALEGKD